MVPWKSLTRPMSQPARCSLSATVCADPFGADWFSKSTFARAESGVAVAIGSAAEAVVGAGVFTLLGVPDDPVVDARVGSVYDGAAGVPLELSAAVLLVVRSSGPTR